MKAVLPTFLLGALLMPAATFEVASIKPAVPDAAGSSGEDGRNGVLKVYNVTLKRAIRYAYRVPETLIFGGPKWIDDLRYDILAKADNPASEAELLKMLQPLLADRFRLVIHHESRPISGYALTIAPGGLKAKLSDPNGHSGSTGGRGSMDAVGSSTSLLAIRLTDVLGRPVVDKTGETRRIDFHLRWTPDDTPADPGSPASDAPSLFTALQEQLGLKLVSQKVPVDVLVVDHAEFPSSN